MVEINASDLRLALYDRRGELIRLAAQYKMTEFEPQIQQLDAVIAAIYDAKKITLNIEN